MIKVELFEGKAYALDEWGNIWQLAPSNDPHLCELRLVTKLSKQAVNTIMMPELARFAFV
jgi:hypothetical protein